MTGYDEANDKLDESFFKDMLLIICRGKAIMTLIELAAVYIKLEKLL